MSESYAVLTTLRALTYALAALRRCISRTEQVDLYGDPEQPLVMQGLVMSLWSLWLPKALCERADCTDCAVDFEAHHGDCYYLKGHVPISECRDIVKGRSIEFLADIQGSPQSASLGSRTRNERSGVKRTGRCRRIPGASSPSSPAHLSIRLPPRKDTSYASRANILERSNV